MSSYHVDRLPEYDLREGRDIDWEGVRAASRKRLLVVDDEAKIRETYKRIFSRAGFEVMTASNAMEANDLLVEEKVDIVLLDINMAEVGGIVLFDVMRAFHDNVRVVVSSVYPLDEQMEMIKEADAYFDKSDGIDVLKEIIASLEERKPRRPPVR